MKFHEFSADQRRIFIDMKQLYEAFIPLVLKSRSYKGGMHWKKAKGREYLFRSTDRFGNGKSLGPRSIKTENILTRFRSGKKEVKDRLSTMKISMKQQAKFCKAAGLGRVPRVVTGILRLLDQEKLMGKNVFVIGTNAMFAYEAAAGLFLSNALTATKDMDIIWDVRPKLSLIVDRETDYSGLMLILNRVDRSFEPVLPGGFRAVNKNGYMIDFVKPEPETIFSKEFNRIGDAGDLVAAEISDLKWLISSKKISQIVMGDDGYPARLVVPDPRAFALHKLWLSTKQDRDPIKKPRDYEQAIATFQLVLQFLPQYPFKTSALRMFPEHVVKKAMDAVKDSDLPVGMNS